MRFAAGSLAIVLCACAGSSEPPPPAPRACDATAATPGAVPEDAGPYKTGYRSFQHTYDAPGAGPRTITVNVWYPTSDEAGEPARYMGLQNDAGSFVDADLAPPVTACGYPVAVYSHGYAAWGGNASFLHRHLTSQGWVVVAPDHTTNLFTDGTPPPDWIRYARGYDVTQALDAVSKLASPDPLAGKLALDKVLMYGHSFGGFTTWAVAGSTYDLATIRARCADGSNKPEACTPAALAAFEKGVRDPRVVAAVALDGEPQVEWFGETGQDSVRVPLLQLTKGDGAEERPLFSRAKGVPLTWVELEGACHESFATGLACPTGGMATDEGFRIVRGYVSAFARHHVLGDRAANVEALVDGTAKPSDKVSYRRK